MKRSLIRSVSVLMLILALALGTMAAPAFAGELGGNGTLEIQLFGQPNGTCAYIQNASTLHFFVGIATGSADGLHITRIVGPLPDQFGDHCTFLGTF
jgi:hypothetical protein